MADFVEYKGKIQEIARLADEKRAWCCNAAGCNWWQEQRELSKMLLKDATAPIQRYKGSLSK